MEIDFLFVELYLLSIRGFLPIRRSPTLMLTRWVACLLEIEQYGAVFSWDLDPCFTSFLR